MAIGDGLMRYLTAPPVPSSAFHLGPGYLGGLRRSRKTGSVKGSVLRPVPAGILDFSFDRPNIARPDAFQSILKDAVRRLGGPEGPVALLLPETCVKTALLSFESLPAAPEEREKVVRWKLQKILPLAAAETRLSFAVHQTEARAKAFCVLAHDAVVREYEQAFAKAGLSVRLVGIPTPALLGCLPRNGASSFLVVNVESDHLPPWPSSAANRPSSGSSRFRRRLSGPKPPTKRRPPSGSWRKGKRRGSRRSGCGRSAEVRGSRSSKRKRNVPSEPFRETLLPASLRMRKFPWPLF